MSHGAGLVRTTCSSSSSAFGPGAGAGPRGASPSEGLLDPVYPRTHGALLKVAQMVREAQGAGAGVTRSGPVGKGSGEGTRQAARASLHGRAGEGRRRRSHAEGRLPPRKWGVQPPPWGSAPPPAPCLREPISRAPSSSRRPLRGLSHVLVETAGKSSFSSSFLFSGPRGFEPEPRLEESPRRRRRGSETRPPPWLRPPLASQPGAQGLALLGALSPQEGDQKTSCSRVGKENRDPRAAILVPCPLEFQGRAWVSGGRWKADDQWRRLVLRSPYLFGGGRIA